MPRTIPALSLEHVKIACETCSLSELCLPRGLSADEVETLAHSIHKAAPIDRGQHLYRAGDAARGLFAVRAGSFKTYMTTPDGEEQVLGFHLPGELIGLDGLETKTHGCGAVALETTTVCGLP